MSTTAYSLNSTVYNMVVVVVAREGRWEGPLCGEEEVFHYGCRLHYIRQAVHMQKPHSRIIGWLILGTSCAADPDPSNMYHFLEPRSVLDPDPT